MLIHKLAYRNLIGQGLRTWLNVVVLSFAYVLIIWHQGLFNGMYKQSTRAMISDEVAGGQFWHEKYDPFDVMSLDESHAKPSKEILNLIEKKQAVPILIRQAAIYPQGRVQSVLIRGIIPNQNILSIPTTKLGAHDVAFPIMIGTRMAENNSFKIGDSITIRLRDANGTFDAVEGEVVEIMNTLVPSIDSSQLWVPIDKLQKISNLENEATIVVVGKDYPIPKPGLGILGEWQFKSQEVLLKDITDMVKSKRVGGFIMYAILLFLVMLAIFDTQVLAIFRRRKEIGTLIALGMTRFKVIMLFTYEGMLNGVLAMGLAAIYGIPWLIHAEKKGVPMPGAADDYGIAGFTDRLYPSYSVGLVVATVCIVLITVTIVSYMPSSRISKLNPTDAIKGKVT